MIKLFPYPAKTSIAVAVSIALVVTPVQTIANMNNAMDAMFVNVTPPSTLNSQQRKGWIGGGAQLRVPNQSVNLVNLSVPRLDVGCSGIDIYLGAFSFISADALKTLIRNIGQAVPYAFLMAVKQMCNPCGAVISFLQQLASVINSANINSCKAAQWISTKAIDMFSSKERAQEEDAFTKMVKGLESDIVTARNKYFTNPKVKETESAQSKIMGNRVFRMLYKRQTSVGIGSTPGLNTEMMEIIMSITGTVSQHSEEEGVRNGETSGRNEGKFVYYDPTLNLADFILGKTGTFKWKCNGSTSTEFGCQTMVIDTNWSWLGIRGYIVDKMFGPQTSDTGALSIKSGSIIDRVQKKTLTADDLKFLQFFDAPLIAMFTEVQSSPEHVAEVANMVLPMMESKLTVTLGTAVKTVVNQLYSGQDNIEKPPYFDERLAQINEQVNAYNQKRHDEHVKKTVELNDFMSVLRKSLPNQGGGAAHFNFSPR